MSRFTGGCLCGAVHYEGEGEAIFSGHCHCTDCRKSSGTGHCSHMVVPTNAVKITGTLTQFAKKADSGFLVTRFFCPACGSPIYSTNTRWPDMFAIRASSLDDPDVFAPQMIVYDSRRVAWDAIDADLPRFAELPLPPG